MTVPALSLQTRRRASSLATLVSVTMVAGASALAFGVMAQEPTRVRLAVSGAACLAAFALLTRAPRHLLYAVIVWLTFVGILRRLLGVDAPSSKADPILLVAPLALGMLVLVASKHRAFSQRTALANGVLGLQALILLGAVNPLQGSIVGGVAGLLFVLVPTLGFWIARGLCDDRTLGVVLRIVATLAVLVAAYGLAQTLNGFPSWDQRWIDSGAVLSLNVNGVIRPFGTMSSAAEYGTFLAVGVMVWIAYWLRAVLFPFAIPVIAMIAVAIFLESSRGLVVLTVAALGVVLGARARLPGILTVGVAVAMLFGLSFAVKHFASKAHGTGTSSVLVSHQLSGLSNPLDPNASTATVHYSLLINGLRAALHNPIGEGIGVITIAGARFGGVAAGTELDPSNVSVALGIPGLIAYLTIVVAGFRKLYAGARHRRDWLSVAALGIVAVTTLQWLNGGQYAVAVLPWLMLGWVDRPRRSDDAQAARTLETSLYRAPS